jgi:hypothetical protein
MLFYFRAMSTATTARSLLSWQLPTQAAGKRTQGRCVNYCRPRDLAQQVHDMWPQARARLKVGLSWSLFDGRAVAGAALSTARRLSSMYRRVREPAAVLHLKPRLLDEILYRVRYTAFADVRRVPSGDQQHDERLRASHEFIRIQGAGFANRLDGRHGKAHPAIFQVASQVQVQELDALSSLMTLLPASPCQGLGR